MDRNKNIDNLRGLAMFSMMLIHACSYFLKDKTTLTIWDNLQWAVPVFLFCSFYLFFDRTKKFTNTDWFPLLKKRFTRLFIPYWIFLVVYFFLLFIFEKKNFNLNYLWANIFLYKGIDFNWLVLLFVYLIFLMPTVLILKKFKPLFYGFFAVSLFSSVYFIFRPFNYRMIMWLPWSVYIFFTLFFLNNKNNKKIIFLTGAFSLLLSLTIRAVEIKIGHNLTQFANKYPPTLYHLSFGIFWITVLFSLSEKNVFSFLSFDRLLHFLSVNSYSLYFIHIVVMFTLNWLHWLPVHWFWFFLEIIGLSSLVQLGLNNLQKLTASFIPVKLPSRSR